MKKLILRTVNSLLKRIDAKIVQASSVQFEMPQAVNRITNHSFIINSVIDIGASDGKWSKSAMGIFPQANFLAIEPLAEREKKLRQLKEKSTRFDYLLSVASDTANSTLPLNIPNKLDSSMIGGTEGEIRMVPCITLDLAVQEKKLNGPYLLKFDTHGHELPILSGAHETLKQTAIIIMEVYNFEITENSLRFHEMCAHLEALGFRCYDIASPMLRAHDQAFWQVDLFFCRKDVGIFSRQTYN